MFETIQELPLLMGLSSADFMLLLEKVEFEFKKHAEGSTLVNQGDRCNRIIYVLSGDICADKREEENNLIISEYIKDKPFVVEPQRMWGMKQNYSATYTFLTDGSTCSIDKKQMNYLISNFDIVKTNLLSMVCNALHSATRQLSRPIPSTIEERMLELLRSHCITQKGRKVLRIKMNTLSILLDTPRINVSRMLNQWQDEGRISIHRGQIEIPDLNELLQAQHEIIHS